jgi:hypothetical protein
LPRQEWSEIQTETLPIIHTTTPHLSTGYLASLQLLFRLRAAIKWAVAGAAGTALPVANPNSTPEFQKFAMIRLILKLA